MHPRTIDELAQYVHAISGCALADLDECDISLIMLYIHILEARKGSPLIDALPERAEESEDQDSRMGRR